MNMIPNHTVEARRHYNFSVFISITFNHRAENVIVTFAQFYCCSKKWKSFFLLKLLLRMHRAFKQNGTFSHRFTWEIRSLNCCCVDTRKTIIGISLYIFIMPIFMEFQVVCFKAFHRFDIHDVFRQRITNFMNHRDTTSKWKIHPKKLSNKIHSSINLSTNNSFFIAIEIVMFKFIDQKFRTNKKEAIFCNILQYFTMFHP